MWGYGPAAPLAAAIWAINASGVGGGADVGAGGGGAAGVI